MASYVVDLETDGLYNDVTKVHCIVMKDIDSNAMLSFSGLADIRDAVNLLKGADLIIGHKFIDYDSRVLKKIFNLELDINKIVDTLLLSYMLKPALLRHINCPPSKLVGDKRKMIGPHSLENWGYYLGQGKIEHEDWSTFTPEMLERCKGDVEITHKLYNYFKG